MLIVCPACASEYQIEIDRVGQTGRSVRCAACRETWFISPDDVAAAQAAETKVDQDFLDNLFEMSGAGTSDADLGPDADAAQVVDQPMPYAAGPTPSAPVSRRRRFPIVAPTLGLGLALFAILPLSLLGRATVVRAMPQSSGLYARIGLPVNLRGIELRDVVASQSPAEGDRAAELTVEGDLIGVARDAVAMADLAIEIRDAHDQTIYRWTAPAPRPVLAQAETARFHVSLSAPPIQGRSVQVRFADAKASDALAAGAPSASEAPAVRTPQDAAHGRGSAH